MSDDGISLAEPEFTTQPDDTTVEDGLFAIFTALATGDEVHYQWQVFNGSSWQDISGATLCGYQLVATRQIDGTRYRCAASNEGGTVYSREALLSVVVNPYITDQPSSVTVPAGSNARFVIQADGGNLNYQWQTLNNGQWYDIPGATDAVYTLTASEDLDGTKYRCHISNLAGSINSSIVTLNIQEGPGLSFYGYHSIIISGKNTYGEWEMYPTSRPHVAQPEVKTAYVDLPGADGGLDYTDLLTGEPRYGYRKGSWEFLLIPQDRWASVYRSLVRFLHGRRHSVILEDDPDYVYTGRLFVNEWKSAAHNSLITIDYILDPFPRSISGSEWNTGDDDLDVLFPDGDSIFY